MKKLFRMRFLLLLFVSMIFAEISFSHSGGLNQQGCHNNRKTGGYHCHRSKSVQQLKNLIAKLLLVINIMNLIHQELIINH